ncbi:ribbon-helix-helix domain-containing protein [Candidatus Pacebacteria bacterium]|nr:ribbon-helix-helix domain-containing protein [Candidatus Paceibacterota bacterium]
MSVINFSIPKVLEGRVEKTIKEKGFVSKAEFFRMAAMYFLEHGASPINPEKRSEQLTRAIKEEVVHKYKGRKIPSAQKQLADL